MRVYHAQDAALELGDGTPLYIEWIIEGEDGNLYQVPAEPGGWFRRSPYRAARGKLERVPEHEAEAIVWLTYASLDAGVLTEHAVEHHEI